MREKPLQKMLISYGLVMLFSVILILFAGGTAYKQGWDAIYEQQESALRQRSQLADSYVMEIRQDMLGLVNNYSTINLPQPVTKLNPASYFDVYKIINYLKNYNMPENMYIAYKDSSVVLSGKASFSQEAFYRTKFKEPSFELEELEDRIFEKGTTTPWYFVLNSKSGDKTWIVLKQVLDYRFATPRVAAFYLMEAEELLSFLGDFCGPEEGNAILRNKEEQVLASQFPINPKADSYIYTCESELAGWSYQLEQPKSIMVHTMWISMELIFGTITAGLIIFLCGASFLYRRNAKMVSSMVHQNRDMQKILLEQVPYVRHDFFKNMLDGKFDSREQMLISAELAGMNTLQKCHGVISVEWSTGEPPVSGDGIRAVQLDILELKRSLNQFKAIAYIYDVSYRRFAVILSGEKMEIEGQINRISQLVQGYSAQREAQTDIGVGGIKSDILEISVSYSEAQCALMNLSVCSKCGVKYFKDLVLDGSGYSFSEQTKNLLFNAVCSGNIEDVREILRQVISSNVEEQNLGEEGLRLFLLEFHGLILKIRNSISIQDEALLQRLYKISAKYYNSEDIVRIQDISQLLEDIAAYVGQSKKVYKDNLIFKIRDYLDSNYRDPNMSLQLLAEKFDITETYLSHLFKKILNIKFSQYLEDLRMQEACRLLKETDLSVMAIVDQSGYASMNTFGRAFKRRYQLSPREYRESKEQ